MILVEGDNLVLRRGNTRQEAPYTPAVYHVLKAVAHVPLALDVMLAPHAGDGHAGRRGPGRAAQIRQPDGGRRARRSSPRAWSPSSSIGRGRSSPRVASSSIRSCRAGDARASERIAFARRMTPMVMKNVGEAARAELDALHARSNAWRTEMTPEEWKDAQGGDPGLGPAAEAEPGASSTSPGCWASRARGRGSSTPSRSATRPRPWTSWPPASVDTGIGVDFFNDPTRMHRDLLSDAAKDYLPLLIDRP